MFQQFMQTRRNMGDSLDDQTLRLGILNQQEGVFQYRISSLFHQPESSHPDAIYLTNQILKTLEAEVYFELCETLRIQNKYLTVRAFEMTGQNSLMNETVELGQESRTMTESSLFRGVLAELTGQHDFVNLETLDVLKQAQEMCEVAAIRKEKKANFHLSISMIRTGQQKVNYGFIFPRNRTYTLSEVINCN